MKTSKTISITIPAALVNRGQAIAQEAGLSQQELAREAYRRFVVQSEYRQLRDYGNKRAKKLGLKARSVNRLIKEYRKEHRALPVTS